MGRPRKYNTEQERKDALKLQKRQHRELLRKFAAGEVADLDEKRRKKWSDKLEKKREPCTIRLQEEREVEIKIEADMVTNLTNEEKRLQIVQKLENERERQRLQQRERRAKMTEEEKNLEREKNRLRCNRIALEKRKKKPQIRTEEDHAKTYFQRQAWLSSMSKEKKEEMKKRRKEYTKKKWESMAKEDYERVLERNRMWRLNLTGEKRLRYYEGMKKNTKRHYQKLRKENPDKWKENMEKIAEANRNRWAKLNLEEKQRRLNQMKLYAAKCRLKKQLEESGASESEIDWKLKEFENIMRKELNIGESKGRGRGRKTNTSTTPPCNSAINSLAVPLPHSTTTSLLHRNDNNDNSKVGPLDSVSSSIKNELTSGIININPTSDIRTKSLPHSPHQEISELFPDDDHNHENDFSDTGSPIYTSPAPSPCCDNTNHDDNQINDFIRSCMSPAKSPLPTNSVSSTSFPCSYCSTSEPFLSEADLRSHIRSKHISSCWKCPKCQEVMLSSDELAHHFKEAHMNQKKSLHYICMQCPWMNENKGEMFETSSGLHAHVKKQHSKHFWPCSYCDLLKYSKQSLNIHHQLCQMRLRDLKKM